MENLELTFQAENQELTATNFTPPLFVASNTVAWIKAKFSLGTNWDCWSLGAVKAMWKFKGEVYSAVLDAEGVCTIPHEVLGEMTGEVKVNLVASSIEDDEVVERMTTYPLYALNVNKKAEVEGDNSVAITPSEYEQFVEDVQEYAQEAYDAKLDAESAQHYAEQAQEGAESAQRLAESAEDDAVTAKGLAENAQTGAENAQRLAESAKDDAIQAKNDAQGYANSASNSATASETNALKSEGYAVGEQDGVPVASGSPYYENNAKYFKEQAEAVAELIPTPTESDYGKTLLVSEEGEYEISDLVKVTELDHLYGAGNTVTRPDGTSYTIDVVGNLNQIDGSTARDRMFGADVVIGDYNQVKGETLLSIIGGHYNDVDGAYVGTIFGSNNKVKVAEGEHNQLYPTVVGSDNEILPEAGEWFNDVVIVGNALKAGERGQTLLGIYNEPIDTQKVIVVGDGTSDANRHNAVVIKQEDGEYSVKLNNTEVTESELAQLQTLKQDIIDLLPTDTASGEIASFPDGANQVPMLSLVADIEPIQAGTPTFYGTEQTPYLLKSIPNGNTESMTKIVGGTVNVNQLQNPSWIIDALVGVTATINNGRVIASGTTSDAGNILFSQRTLSQIELIGGHKYLMVGWDKHLGGQVYFYNPNYPTLYAFSGITNTQVATIINSTITGNCSLVFNCGANVEIDVDVTPQLIDLTAFFGSSAIADYLYTLESGTAGAGIAKLREWGFVSGTYVPYNTGTLVSVRGLTYHKTFDADNNLLGETALDSSVILRGIPKLDAGNNLYYDGDEYASNGTVTRRYGIVDLGTLNWTYDSTNSIFKAQVSGAKAFQTKNIIDMVCAKYTVVGSNNTSAYSTNDRVLWHGTASTPQCYIKDSAYTDATTFTTDMSGVYLVYELATPTTSQATPYTSSLPIVAGGTEQFVGSDLPVGNSTTYHDVFPISGRTEVTVERTGKNLCDGTAYPIALNSGLPFLVSTTAVTSPRTVPAPYQGVGFVAKVKAGTTYVASTDLEGNVTRIYWGIYSSLSDMTDRTNCLQYNSTNNGVISVDYDGYLLFARYGTANQVVTWSYAQLEVGSTATAYEPYTTPLTITTQLGQTVYGGTLDVVSGRLVVDRAMVDLGTLNWLYSSGTQRMYSTGINSVSKHPTSDTVVANILCENYATDTDAHTASHTSDKICALGSTGILYVYDSAYTDAVTFKIAMNRVQLVYELATPITVQLTPTEVKTLLGTNNVWADSGEVEVTYKADIQKYIDKQISAVLNA